MLNRMGVRRAALCVSVPCCAVLCLGGFRVERRVSFIEPYGAVRCRVALCRVQCHARVRGCWFLWVFAFVEVLTGRFPKL